ncbi:MAG: AAA family ATPase [Muribaculaceae bacterium]
MKNFNIFTTPAPFKPTNIQPSEPKQLQPGMWYEGEIACLLGDQQSGKSLLAIQIAERVAREHSKDTVLYFDFKMTAAEFTRRYSRAGKPYVFPENLLRCGLDYSADSGNDVDNIIGGIEQQCKALNSKIIIIDSLTWINTIAIIGSRPALHDAPVSSCTQTWIVGPRRRRDLQGPLAPPHHRQITPRLPPTRAILRLHLRRR